jgi:hypothetical protein
MHNMYMLYVRYIIHTIQIQIICTLCIRNKINNIRISYIQDMLFTVWILHIFYTQYILYTYNTSIIYL